MVDTGAAANERTASDKLDKDDNCGYASGEWKSDDGSLSCGYSSFIGKRLSMEDFYDIKTSEVEGQSVWLFGIFDGHGGARAAEFLKGNLFDNLLKHSEFIANTKLALSETYKQTDMDFLESERDTFRDDGSTASAAVLFGSHLYVANVGDSRTIICKAGKAIPLSDDHKPNRSDERKRIESAGGRITWAGTWRVGGILAMSRAFGNRMLKRFVVAEPEIQDMEINEDLEFLVLASDGLWDVMANEDAVSLVRAEEEPEAAARKLTEAAFSRGSSDNITCIVVKFHHMKAYPENHHIEADLENRQVDADLENDPMKAYPENDPMKTHPENRQVDADLENGPMKAYPENNPMKAYPENRPVKADPETMKAYPDNDPMKVHPMMAYPDNDPMKVHPMKAYPDNDPMKVHPVNRPMKADPENDPLKGNRENHPMKPDPENS